jgi:hypothetical protein
LKIPASEKELELVRKTMQQLKEHLAQAAETSRQAIEMLDDNFLAVNKEYINQIRKEVVRIESSVWLMNVQLYRMSNNKERIVSAEIFEF